MVGVITRGRPGVRNKEREKEREREIERGGGGEWREGEREAIARGDR